MSSNLSQDGSFITDIDDYINELDKYDTIERSIYLAEEAEYIREENIKYLNETKQGDNNNATITNK